MSCMSSLRSWLWSGTAPISDPRRFISESPPRPFYCDGLPPQSLWQGGLNQAEHNNRCHISHNIVLVVVMDITTAHPIIKRRRNWNISHQKLSHGGGRGIQFGNSNWPSQFPQSMSVMGCFVYQFDDTLTSIHSMIFSLLLWLLFLNLLTQNSKYGYHRSSAWLYRAATVYVEGMASPLLHKNIQTQNPTSVVSRAKSIQISVWKSNRNPPTELDGGVDDDTPTTTSSSKPHAHLHQILS